MGWTLFVSLLTSCGAPSARPGAPSASPDERADPLMETPLFAEGSTYRFRIRATRNTRARLVSAERPPEHWQVMQPQLTETNGTLTIAAVRPDGTAELVWDFGPVTRDLRELRIGLPPLRTAEPHTQRERRDQRGRQVGRSDDTARSLGFSFGLGLFGAELPPHEVGVAETWPVAFAVPDELAEDNEGTCRLFERGEPTHLSCELEATAAGGGACTVLEVKTYTSLKPGAPLTRRVMLRAQSTAGRAETTFEHELCLVPEGSELSEAGCWDIEDQRPAATSYVDRCEERVAAFEARLAELPPVALQPITVSPLPVVERAQPMRARAVVEELFGDEVWLPQVQSPAPFESCAQARTDRDEQPLHLVAAAANAPVAGLIWALTRDYLPEHADFGLAVQGPPVPEVDPVPESAAEWLRDLVEERSHPFESIHPTDRFSIALSLMEDPGGLCFPTMLPRCFVGYPEFQASWLAQRTTSIPEAIRACGCQSVDIDAVEALLVRWSQDHPPVGWLPLNIVAEGGTAVRLPPGATFQDLATAIERRGDRAAEGIRLVLRAR